MLVSLFLVINMGSHRFKNGDMETAKKTWMKEQVTDLYEQGYGNLSYSMTGVSGCEETVQKLF